MGNKVRYDGGHSHDRFLTKTLVVDDYLMPMDLEYPEFSRAMCHLERVLLENGKQLLQTDPFVDALLLIHDSFAKCLSWTIANTFTQ